MMRITPLGASAVLVTLLTSSAAIVLMKNRHSFNTKPKESTDGTPDGHDSIRAGLMKRGSETKRTGRAAARRSENVYVTERGTRYHRDDCRLVRAAKSAIPIEEARGSYQPCKVCLPPA
jgi:hypothetical protein